MKNFLIVLIIALGLSSCQQPKETKVRIVGVDGKESRHIETRIPEFNAQVQANQGYQPNPPVANTYQKSAQVPSEQPANPSQYKDFGSASDGIVKSTLGSKEVAQNPEVMEDPGAAEKKAGSERINPALIAGVAEDDKNKVVEYDLSKSEDKVINGEEQKSKPASGKEKKFKSLVKKSSGQYFVQVGSFSNPDNADKALSRMKKFSKGIVETSENGNKTLYRALLGPFVNKQKAQAMMARVKKAGYDAVLVK